MPKLFVNDQMVEVEEGSYLLQAIEKSGFKVPTLCYHPALSPYGACRLCVVEIEIPNGRRVIEASCSYPAQEGLKVYTETEKVKRARKIVAELLLARCPDSDFIQNLAKQLGVTELRINRKYDDCIYCGLCVRICEQRMGRSAIGFTGRGPRKKLESPFGEHNPMCWVCGACNYVCPVGKKVNVLTTDQAPKPIPNIYNLGLNGRSSIYIFYPQTVPNVPVIDPSACIKLNYEQCEVCSEVCPAKAIDYTQKDEEIKVEVGAVLLSPGFKVYDPSEKEDLGYKRYPNVITAIEFERILSSSGPYSGEVKRPSDNKEPKKIAFIQCVGSREAERDYCSAVCCMFATKEAIVAKEHIGEDLECDIYYMDVRAFSKGFENYYNRAKELGIRYIWGRVPLIKENPENHNLIIEYLDENDIKRTAEYDMAVLSVGMEAPEDAKKLAEKFGIELGNFNFCKTSIFEPTKTTKEGIFVAGPFSEPKDIPETVTQASAAASKISALLKEVRFTLTQKKEYPAEIDVKGQPPRIGVFICHCGTNIAGVVNVPEVVEYTKTLPNVVYAENNLYTCSTDTQERIKEKIKEYNLNRVVVAACTPRTHERLFRNTIRETGLNKYLFEMANIRDQCSWVHMFEKEKATQKAKDLVRMAVAKAKLLEPLPEKYLEIKKSALVIGGGLSGMAAAIELAEQGYDVYLIEKEKELGGNMRKIHYLLNGEDPQKELYKIIERVKNHERIKVYTSASIESVEGSVGNFITKIKTNGTVEEINHGVVIIAIGAREYKPKEYLYGKNSRVITQIELEEKIAKGEFGKNLNPKTVVMIQCVGSRDEKRPYCSRICCTEAIKNALKIKEISPETNIYVLYRDIRTYGFRESYYTKARQRGVVFLKYPDDKKPEVRENGDSLIVKVFERTFNEEFEIPADLVVLSTGIAPSETSKDISQLFKIPLTQEGFFLEAHMKLRPVDFATDGVFLAGLAHAPKFIEECISQAQAAAMKAGTILAKDRLELESTISHIIDENCDGCAYCVDTCPFKAITLLEYVFKDGIKKTVEVNESICKGCGTCMATCPKRGAMVKGFTLDQIQAQIDAALESVLK